jgi:3-hydroxyisobutyrate dehydrogenase-like beta-hydroxyacid dehydrogenase
MAEEIRRVGFIGLGRMGSAIAGNILKAGFQLTVYNRTAEKMKALIAEGAAAASSPREAAAGADAVLTCLMDDASVLDNVTGENGLLAGLKPGAVHIGTTTVSPRCAAQLADLHAAHGSHYVAAPLVGRPDVAARGQLLTFVAGDPEVIAKCTPVFQAYTLGVTNVGNEPRLANSLKLALNYVGISLIELMGQVYAFGEKSGIDVQFLNQMLHTMVGPPALREYADRIRDRNFDDVGFDLLSGLKDVELMLQASTDTRVALSYASIIKEKFLAAIAHGMGGKDWSAIYELTRMNAGLE